MLQLSAHGFYIGHQAYLAAGRLRRGSLETNLTGWALTSVLASSLSPTSDDGSGEPRGTAEMVESLSAPGDGGSEKGFRVGLTTAQGVTESSSGSPRSRGGGGSRLVGLNMSVDGVEGWVSAEAASSPDFASFSSASEIVTPAELRSKELKTS
jgi:hypothetical protein